MNEGKTTDTIDVIFSKPQAWHHIARAPCIPSVILLAVPYCLLHNKLHEDEACLLPADVLEQFIGSLPSSARDSDSYCYSPVAYSVTKDACFRALYKGWSRYYSGLCENPLFTFGLCSYSFTCESIATIVNIGFTKHECCNVGTGVAWQRPTLLGLTCKLCGNGLGHCYNSRSCTRTILDHIVLSSVYTIPWTGTPEQCYERGGLTWQGYDGICYSLDFGECYYSFTCTSLLKVSGYYTKNECCNGGGTGWARVGQQCEPCPYQYACFPGSGCSGGFLVAYNGSGGDRCCNSGGQSWIGASTRMCTPCSGVAVHSPTDIHPPTLPTQPPRGTLPVINQELPTPAELTARPQEVPAGSTPSGVDQGSAASSNRCDSAIGTLMGVVLLYMYY